SKRDWSSDVCSSDLVDRSNDRGPNRYELVPVCEPVCLVHFNAGLRRHLFNVSTSCKSLFRTCKNDGANSFICIKRLRCCDDFFLSFLVQGIESFRPIEGNQPNILTSFNDDVVVIHGLSPRSEEHTSELQSRFDLVCRLLLEKKNYN